MKKTLITLGLFTSLGAMAQNGGIAINNTGVNPNANAMLDVQSDSKGILIPRLTTVARNTLGTALALPDNGMMVYDKDMNLFFYWDGTQWVQVGSGSGDNWGTQVVQTSGTNISGDGTTGNPLTVTDGDSDPTNEIELPTGGTNGQVLSTDGSGTYTWVNDNTGTDNQNIQNLAFDASTNILTVGIQNGNSQTVDLTGLLNDADSDPTNEIQDLSLNTTTNILTITNNGTPTNIDLTPYLDNTDNQDLSLNGNTLSLTNDGTTVDLSGYLDNTDNQNISGSGLSGTILTIGIQNGTSQTVDLSSLTDADWYKVGTTSAPSSINDDIFTQGKVGIGVITPFNKLHIYDMVDGVFSGLVIDNRKTYGNGTGTNETSRILLSLSEASDPNPNNKIMGYIEGGVLSETSSTQGYLAFGTRLSATETEKMRILNNGNVGINTTTPTEKLEVQGSVKIVDGTQGAGKVLTSDANGKGSWQYSGVPAGAIMAFNLATCPTGWAPADGTGGMPDLRGEFVRGLDNGRGVDVGRTLGSAQGDAIRNIVGDIESFMFTSMPGFNSPSNTFYHNGNYNPYITANLTSGSNVRGYQLKFDASRLVPTAPENRPRNVAFLYCIKQ